MREPDGLVLARSSRSNRSRTDRLGHRAKPGPQREDTAVNETIKLIAESDAGAVYHDELNDEWLVDVASKGITLYFDQEEFQQFLQLLRPVLSHSRDIETRPSVPAAERDRLERSASGE
jgi:hypothetical protein